MSYLALPEFDQALAAFWNGLLIRLVIGLAAKDATPIALPPMALPAPVTALMALPAEEDISPAWMDCQPALSARIPVRMPEDFLAASKPP